MILDSSAIMIAACRLSARVTNRMGKTTVSSLESRLPFSIDQVIVWSRLLPLFRTRVGEISIATAMIMAEEEPLPPAQAQGIVTH